MPIEATRKTPALPALGAKRKGRLDWEELRRRIDAANAALEQRLAPGREERQKILRARARALAVRRSSTAAAAREFIDVVEFVLGTEHYGIESSLISEIYPLSEFTAVPCTPAFVLGLVNLRGQILSIINLKKLFDLPEKGLTDLNKVIVVSGHGKDLGILADAIVGTRSIAAEDLSPALPTMTGIRGEFLKGMTRHPMVLLDVERILAADKISVNEVL